MMTEIDSNQLFTVGAFHELMCPTFRVPADYPSTFRVSNFCFPRPTKESEVDTALFEFVTGQKKSASSNGGYSLGEVLDGENGDDDDEDEDGVAKKGKGKQIEKEENNGDDDDDSNSVEKESTLSNSAELAKLPLVYLGFGSMPAPDPQKMADLAVDIGRFMNVRLVICGGWSGVEWHTGDQTSSLSSSSSSKTKTVIGSAKAVDTLSQSLHERIFVCEQAPHDWLFPYCSVVVHHAGVGTCGAVLASGALSVCCPVMLDQPHNAAHLQKLG